MLDSVYSIKNKYSQNFREQLFFTNDLINLLEDLPTTAVKYRFLKPIHPNQIINDLSQEIVTLFEFNNLIKLLHQLCDVLEYHNIKPKGAGKLLSSIYFHTKKRHELNPQFVKFISERHEILKQNEQTGWVVGERNAREILSKPALSDALSSLSFLIDRVGEFPNIKANLQTLKRQIVDAQVFESEDTLIDIINHTHSLFFHNFDFDKYNDFIQDRVRKSPQPIVRNIGNTMMTLGVFTGLASLVLFSFFAPWALPLAVPFVLILANTGYCLSVYKKETLLSSTMSTLNEEMNEATNSLILKA